MQYLDTVLINLQNHISLLTDFDLTEIKAGDAGGGSLSEVVTGVKTVGQDVYSLLMWVGGFGCVILLILAAISFGISGQSNKRQEAKSWIGSTIIVAVIIFAAVFIIGLAKTIGVNLEDTATP